MIRTWKGMTPKIHQDAFVSEAAYVIGDVEIGAGSSVWPGSVIRGDSGKIKIGRNTCIQDNSTIHADGRGAEIGDNVVMGHNVLCHADKVGDNAALGNGAVVSGSTIIGKGAVIAAGAVVIDGVEVPDNTLIIGIPGTAKGQVTDKQAERFRRTAEHYADLAREYKKQGDLE